MTLRLTIWISLILFTAAVLINSCGKKDVGPKGPTPLTFKTPPGFPEPNYKFVGNPLTEEGFQLGRKLFYDGRLSKDGNFPCASCHQQFAGFVTFDHDLSHGFNNQFTLRNSPGIFNMAWQKEFQWDGGVANIEVQPLAPITAPNEMAEDINNVISKLKADSAYRVMFKKAFGDEEINSQRMLRAITQFVVSIVSAESKYDKVKTGQATFTTDENMGYSIFQAKCASCHAEPLFTDFSYRNNGMPLNTTLKDYGRMRITNKKEDSLKFKVPSLRNVMLTSPYGHDGRFFALPNVFDHYTSGIQDGPTLDPLLKNKLPLSTLDRFYLREFLKTLTDSTIIKDQRFSEPK